MDQPKAISRGRIKKSLNVKYLCQLTHHRECIGLDQNVLKFMKFYRIQKNQLDATGIDVYSR